MENSRGVHGRCNRIAAGSLFAFASRPSCGTHAVADRRAEHAVATRFAGRLTGCRPGDMSSGGICLVERGGVMVFVCRRDELLVRPRHADSGVQQIS